MPKPNPAADLAGRLVQLLHAEKQAGAYPPTLRQLLARAQATDAVDLPKALTHKVFKSQVIVAARKNRDAPVALTADADRLADSPLLLEFAVGLLSTAKKPLHPVAKIVAKVDARLRDAFAATIARRLNAGDLPPNVAVVQVKDAPHLCLRPYLPRLAPEVELAGKLLRALEDHRRRSDYPVTLARLLHDTDSQASAELVGKALVAKAFKPHVLLALPHDAHTPVALKSDADQLARWPGLLEAVLANMRTADNQAFLAKDLAKKLAKPLRVPFMAAVDHSVSAATLPATVGCVRIKAKPYLFLVRDVGVQLSAAPAPVPAPRKPAPAPIDFATWFDKAFQEIDRQTGSHNFVSLVDLRRVVQVERTIFDEGLRQLRQAGRYTLSGAEGRHGISDEERAAGVNENGALLLYVSRRRT
jgi:hypothetical protein